MADRPILFSAPMVKALLGGRKTQTRRALKIRGHQSFSEFGPSDTRGYDWHFRDSAKRWHDLRNRELVKRLSYAIGDRLWVREAVRASENDMTFDREIEYLADEWRSYVCPEEDNSSDAFGRWWDLHAYRSTDPDLNGDKIVPPIHMPRWASRLTLIVTDVRVQRLHDISEEDAIAEGLCPRVDGWFAVIDERRGLSGAAPDARSAFAMLWNVINGPGAWDANPWIAAYTFTVHRCNIDQMEPSHD